MFVWDAERLKNLITDMVDRSSKYTLDRALPGGNQIRQTASPASSPETEFTSL